MERSVIINAKYGQRFTQSFKAVANKLSEPLPIMGKSGSEVSYFIPEHRSFEEVTRLNPDIRNPWLKKTSKDIQNLFKNQTFLVDELEKGEPVTPCMYVYKENIQSDVSLDKLKLRIVVI